MQAFRDFWKGFRLLPSAWLLIVQFFILILSSISHDSHISYRAISWVLGALALLLIAKVIRQSPAFTALGLFFVSGALLFSILILLGYREPAIQITAHIFESLAYFYAAYGLLRYMFADRYLTKDEMFAAGAVFTLLAWGFAFLYNICQLIDPNSFIKPEHIGLKSWLDILFWWCFKKYADIK